MVISHVIWSYHHIIWSDHQKIFSYNFFMIISQCYMIISHLFLFLDHITMLYDDITISCHEIMRPHHQMKAQGHQASSQATPRPAQVTASHPKANIRLRFRNRHIKSRIKYVIIGRKQSLVKDNRKSFGEKLRVVANYTLLKDSSKTLLEIRFLRCCRKSENLNFGAPELPPSEPVR